MWPSRSELGDEAFGVGAAGEVVAAEVSVGGVVFEDVAAAAFDLLVLGPEVAVLGAGGGVG